jgi:hypothetical protein
MYRVHLTGNLKLIRARRERESTELDKSLLRKAKLWDQQRSAKEDKFRIRQRGI